MNLKDKYGSTALIAGGSEGIGEAYANQIAAQGIDIILIARRLEPLEKVAEQIRKQYKVKVDTLSCDLALDNAHEIIRDKFSDRQIDILIYNAALSYIGKFEKHDEKHSNDLIQVNVTASMNLAQTFGSMMLERGKGAIVLMSSMAGFQGTPFISAYAASKAFNRVFAEGLWYEWKERGVDVMACCAGATSSPGYLDTKPKSASFIKPKVQTPDEVVKECLKRIGTTASYVSGTENKLATFFLHRLLPRNLVLKIMGSTTEKMYADRL